MRLRAHGMVRDIMRQVDMKPRNGATSCFILLLEGESRAILGRVPWFLGTYQFLTLSLSTMLCTTDVVAFELCAHPLYNKLREVGVENGTSHAGPHGPVNLFGSSSSPWPQNHMSYR